MPGINDKSDWFLRPLSNLKDVEAEIVFLRGYVFQIEYHYRLQ
jgi:hypothetical protein